MVSEARVPWHQSFALREVYFAVVAVSVCAAILAGESATPARRLGAVAALVALAAWYLAYGRRLAAADDRTIRGVVSRPASCCCTPPGSWSSTCSRSSSSRCVRSPS